MRHGVGGSVVSALLLGVACSAGGGGDKQTSGGSSGSGGSSAAGGSGGASGAGNTGGSGATGGGGGTGGMAGTPPVECDSPADAGGFTFERIAVWRDDAKAAYSMIHDDLCGGTLRGIDQLAVPALRARGLTAGLGPYVEACEDGALWSMVAEAESYGNEIINHSYTHPEISTANAVTEVTGAKTEFDKHTTKPVSFYIFPFDYFTPETLAIVQSSGHIGARAGNRDDNDGFDNPPINSADPIGDLEIEFDVWPRTYSKYARFRAEDILSVHVWNAIEKGGWALREFHSVSPDPDPPQDGSQGFGPVPIVQYEKHLDFLLTAWKENLVWTAPPSTVIRYRHARTACKASVAGSTLSYDTAAADCTKFATPISVIVKTANDVASVQALQGGKAVDTRKITAKSFSITTDPTAGAVELSGCSTPGPEVGGGGTVDTKPSPASSVCDLQGVVGTGSPGKMDDLERPVEEFQALPNPSQGDGRDGSWSWYPQNATVGQFKEGTNTVLRYAGTNLAAWSGVTLAFLGGNGAGACYDASAYAGLRFKIKGTVTSTDELNGKIIVSIVTAETQTQKFGGDLAGDGGHFNKQVPVTSAWTTVSIAWTELATPTWGATTSLPAVAVKKLQAIDWGVSDKTSSFEIFLDDIELY